MVHRADPADLEGDLRAVRYSSFDPGQEVRHVLCTEIGRGEASASPLMTLTDIGMSLSRLSGLRWQW